jgi:acyl-CoA reductase-like NAD-dependent aldehyde dehydrogenase
MTHQILGTQRRNAHINGKPVDAKESFAVLDPATGLELAQVAACGPDEVDQAVSAARRALDRGWKRTSAAERARVHRKN